MVQFFFELLNISGTDFDDIVVFSGDGVALQYVRVSMDVAGQGRCVRGVLKYHEDEGLDGLADLLGINDDRILTNRTRTTQL